MGPDALQKRLLKIAREAQTAEEESGINILYLALGFGVLGYLFRKLDVPKAPLLFGLILGHTLEQSFRQALTISNGDPTVFFRSPIAAGLLFCAAVMVGASVWSKRRPVKELQQAEERIAQQRLAEEQR